MANYLKLLGLKKWKFFKNPDFALLESLVPRTEPYNPKMEQIDIPVGKILLIFMIRHLYVV